MKPIILNKKLQFKSEIMNKVLKETFRAMAIASIR